MSWWNYVLLCVAIATLDFMLIRNHLNTHINTLTHTHTVFGQHRAHKLKHKNPMYDLSDWTFHLNESRRKYCHFISFSTSVSMNFVGLLLSLWYFAYLSCFIFFLFFVVFKWLDWCAIVASSCFLADFSFDCM